MKRIWGCANCCLREQCLPAGLDENEIELFGQAVTHNRSVRRHDAISRTGVAFQFLYALRNGVAKSTLGNAHGSEQVTGVYMPGDVIGLEAIGSGIHACDLVALQDCNVCVISFVELERLSRVIPRIQRNLHRILSREITRRDENMLWLGSMRIESRIALFLVNLSKRHAVRGCSPVQFSLLLTRHELGSYLGARLETVSRVFSRFQKDGLIKVHEKEVVIENMERLIGFIANSCKIPLIALPRKLPVHDDTPNRTDVREQAFL